jgi:hypothetical protein
MTDSCRKKVGAYRKRTKKRRKGASGCMHREIGYILGYIGRRGEYMQGECGVCKKRSDACRNRGRVHSGRGRVHEGTCMHAQCTW